jgi:hypothetical protein
VERPKLRGAAAREPKASARGVAGVGKRAASLHMASTMRNAAHEVRGVPGMPLVALAMQFARLSAEHSPARLGMPAMLVRGGD